MELKWCYKCDTDKLLREFYGPKEHKNSMCSKCYDNTTKSDYQRWGFGGLNDEPSNNK